MEQEEARKPMDQMDQISATGPNADQIEFWNGDAAKRWVELGAQMDAMLQPIGVAAMDRAAPAPGDRVLDVGCGCGETTIDLAQRVAPGGSVTGIDISAVMLSRAGQRAKPGNGVDVTFENADAETHRFDDASFDHIFSCFGVMFFQNPTAAFANLRKALGPAGRFTFICWRAPRENPWVAVPMSAAKRHVDWPEAPPADGPGEFAFAERARFEDPLRASGFQIEAVDALDIDVTVGGGGGVKATIDFFMQQGPAARVMGEATEAQRAAVKADLAETLAPYLTDEGVRMSAGTWLVSAKLAR